MRRARVAGPPGRVVRSPKKSTSMPVPARSRSHSRARTWFSLRALAQAAAASGPKGTTWMPNWLRRSVNQRASSGGSICSTTAVTVQPRTSVSQNAAHSQAPRWGMARIAPLPASRASSMWWAPTSSMPAARASGDVPGRRNDSNQ